MIAIETFSLLVVVSVPKLDLERCQLGVTTPRWSLCLVTTYGYAIT